MNILDSLKASIKVGVSCACEAIMFPNPFQGSAKKHWLLNRPACCGSRDLEIRLASLPVAQCIKEQAPAQPVSLLFVNDNTKM